jgi:hypothetical protein
MANREICKYCRNLVLFGEEIPDEQAEEKAIMMCDCQGARIHQRARERQEKAKDNIELAIHETDEKVCEYLKQCVELVDRRNIAKITVNNGRGVTVTVSKTNKDTIKVAKKVSKDVVYDE